MNDLKNNNFLFNKVANLKGVGVKLSNYLRKKRIEKINDLIWNFPYSSTNRSHVVNLKNLEVGKVSTIKIIPTKYNFPRIRNLPSKVLCQDSKGKIDIIFFNSREGYIRKVLPLKKEIIVSGKINYFRGKYQITNPDYIVAIERESYITKEIPKYSLTDGLTEKSYRKIIEQTLEKIPDLKEWHDEKFINKNKFPSWKDSILKMHDPSLEQNYNSNFYRRLAYDEIFSHLLVLSNNRENIKKIKKKPKIIDKDSENDIIKELPFVLTNSQNKVISEIKKDLGSNAKMFRIIQGDVGSGKTIVALITALSVIESGYQVAIMAPTEILAKQHYVLAKKILSKRKINIEFITGKIENKKKILIIKNLTKKKIDLIIGTHSLFQKKISFNKLGYVIVDEQHKFGVKQRMDLSKKGGNECDVLLMSATPIPRSMMLTIYGDMDISRITEKPAKRKKIITLSKPEKKINELWPYIKKQIIDKNQIFWVCPLIEESKFFDYSSAVKRFDEIKKKFPNRIGLLHGSMDKEEKNFILNEFLKKKIDILVSTTVIEVGIDFPNANLIIIENANKFGLAQLHQLRGRVGRGTKQGVCILLFKDALSKNAIKRIKILKSTDDGFIISEEDMKLRGYGDIVGFQQSGSKYFRIADPVHHEDLFQLAEEQIKNIRENIEINKKYNFLLKLFDRAEIFNDQLVN
jgi:ATP-dependent DNA helicase RecG